MYISLANPTENPKSSLRKPLVDGPDCLLQGSGLVAQRNNGLCVEDEHGF